MERGGGHSPFDMGGNLNDEKKEKITIHLGLRWPLIDYFTCNNQPKKIPIGVGW